MSWIGQANQRVLVAEFARLRARIAGDDTTMADQELSSGTRGAARHRGH